MPIEPRDLNSPVAVRARQTMYAAQSSDLAPDLAVTVGTRAVEAWFLGPRAENAELLERLLVQALRDQVFWRRNFHPGDPPHITPEALRSEDYLHAVDVLTQHLDSLLAFLKKSVPFFSMRYQGHMNWDTSLPGIVGYFAAMLYNPNNVAYEGSTATTIIEELVGDDLCRMLGYVFPDDTALQQGAIRPWGHITCDGTVANIEAIWAARNLKCYPLAIKAALTNEDALTAARDLTIALPTGESRPLLALDTWQLMNLKADDVLGLPERMLQEYAIRPETLANALAGYALQNIGLVAFTQRFLTDLPQRPIFTVPGTKHYSFPKAAAILGIGATNMVSVAVDKDARQSLAHLEAILDDCLTNHRPVYMVVAVIGTTEESAVDPLRQILDMRETYRAKGLDFTVHADAAWGGYHACLIRDDFPLPEPLAARADIPLVLPANQHVVSQLEALSETDSITVDPHKSGYIPYPAGALCYRNAAMRDSVTFSAPVIYHGGAEPTVGIYGIEGSKPGASPAAVYLSHRVIRPSKSGYGKIIGEALFSCRKLYARILGLSRPDDPFVAVPVPRLPIEKQGGSQEEAQRQKDFIRERIYAKSNADILQDHEASALLPEIGPDQNILAYAFNYRDAQGHVNTDLERANQLNTAIYKRLSISPGDDIYSYDLIVSSSDFALTDYGEEFFSDLTRRLGVDRVPGVSSRNKVTVLRSVVMDPWITETTNGSFLDILENALRNAVLAAVEEVFASPRKGY